MLRVNDLKFHKPFRVFRLVLLQSSLDEVSCVGMILNKKTLQDQHEVHIFMFAVSNDFSAKVKLLHIDVCTAVYTYIPRAHKNPGDTAHFSILSPPPPQLAFLL